MRQLTRVYLAAGWFNPEQKKQMDEIYQVLHEMEERMEIELFAPYYDGIVLKKDDPDLKKKMKTVWWLDIEMLKNSELIVASTQDHDVGTIFECGYASACGRTIFCYNSNPELGLNVMLAQEARGFIKSKEDLKLAVRNFCSFISCKDNNPKNYRFNAWKGEPI